MIHALKTIQPYFDKVANGRKNFEVRKDDRSYSVGDILILQEWDAANEEATGNVLIRQVKYILDHKTFPEGIMPGFVVMALQRVQEGTLRESFIPEL